MKKAPSTQSQSEMPKSKGPTENKRRRTSKDDHEHDVSGFDNEDSRQWAEAQETVVITFKPDAFECYLDDHKAVAVRELNPVLNYSSKAVKKIYFGYWTVLKFSESRHCSAFLATKPFLDDQGQPKAESCLFCVGCAFAREAVIAKHKEEDCQSRDNSELNRLMKLCIFRMPNLVSPPPGTVLVVRHFKPIEIEDVFALKRVPGVERVVLSNVFFVRFNSKELALKVKRTLYDTH